jgi:hypothetical protein
MNIEAIKHLLLQHQCFDCAFLVLPYKCMLNKSIINNSEEHVCGKYKHYEEYELSVQEVKKFNKILSEA